MVLPVHELNGNVDGKVGVICWRKSCIEVSPTGKKKFRFTIAHTFFRNYRFLMAQFTLTARALLDLHAKTEGERKEKLVRPVKRFPGSPIAQKVISGIISRTAREEGRKGVEWTRCNRERTRLSSSVVREHRFMFRISSFLRSHAN